MSDSQQRVGTGVRNTGKSLRRTIASLFVLPVLTLTVAASALLVPHAAAQAPPTSMVQPIFKPSGGDVAAGVRIATPTVPCAAAQSVPNAGIASWNFNGTPNFAGAGGEYAAIALGQVKDYVTGQGTNQQPAGSETNRLTFANGPTVNFANGVFGGMFGYTPCVDYWDKKPANSALTPFNGSDISGLNGEYRHPSATPLTLNAATVPAGSHITIYVDGDVVINGNIRFAAGTWTDRRQIPSFRLIVHGVIHIAPNVTRLDGLYAAIPDASARTTSASFTNPLPGTISTCSNGTTAYNPNDFFTSNYAITCTNRLAINGSVVAHQVWMLRTPAGLSGNAPAETINYTPETWLSIVPGDAARSDTGYQSIMGLPPIL